MPNYTYKARDPMGKLVSGKMESPAKEDLIDKLRKMGYMTTYITEARPVSGVEALLARLKKPSTEEMVMFYAQLSNMLTAGIPILTCLNTLTGQISNERLKDAVREIARSIEGGDSFSQATAKHPAIFPKLFMSMVKAGEASGTLDVLIARYAKYFEGQADLQQKVKGALFYPAILLVTGVGVMLFIISFIIPQFVEIFRASGVGLPVPTIILYSIGIAIKRYWYLGVLAFAGLYIVFKAYANTEKGRLNIDSFRLEAPLMGGLTSKAALARFSRTLATLLSSGVPILESLDITRKVVRNEVLARVIDTVRSSVEKGASLSEPLKISGRIPADTVQMIAIGEESGKLDEMLDKIADFYDISIGYAIKKLTTMLEPLFLLIMGGMVGFIMASMLLPIFDMAKVIGR